MRKAKGVPLIKTMRDGLLGHASVYPPEQRKEKITTFVRNLIHFKTSEEVAYDKFIANLMDSMPTIESGNFVFDRDKLTLAKDIFARCEELRDQYLMLVDSLEMYIDFDTHYACVAMCSYTYPLVGEAKDMMAEMMFEADAVDMWHSGNDCFHIEFEFMVVKNGK